MAYIAGESGGVVYEVGGGEKDSG